MAAKRNRKNWLKQHLRDPFVKQSVAQGYRSRACFKLIELHDKYQLFKPGMRVIDLGAAPGGWSQVVAPLIQPHGQLIAVDKLTMAPIPDVQILEGDIYDPEIDAAMLALLGEQRVHWVLSDMAPNLTGHWDIDQPRVMGLAEWSLSFAQTLLQPGGGLLIKLFHGQGVEAYIKLVRSHFQKVALKKPQASRAPSREVYLLAQGYGLTKKISKR